MKRMKKLMAFVIAVAMVLAMGVSVFAADGKKITLTGGKAGHTYTLYQVFTGTVDGDELTNIQWGSDVTADFKATKTTAAAYAQEVKEADDARATAEALIAASALTGGKEVTLTADGNVVFDNLAEGYYVVVDENGNTTPVEGDYTSAVIVQVVKSITMELKGSAPTSEKKTKAEDGTVQDASDYDIGDDVPFQLKATTAANVAAYKKYHVTFQDKQSAGLDAPSKFTITVPGTDETMELAYNATEAVTKEVTFGEGDKAVTVIVKAEKVTPDQGRTFAVKVSFENADADKYLPADLNSSSILVDYTSKLNENANMGSTGNPNEMYINYSNNPEDDDDSEEGKTPDDKVTVFTYKLQVNKTDAEGNALKGAGFTLYKKNAEGGYDAIGQEVSGADLTSFTWAGLDSGSYKLVETKVPKGYNKADDITFDVVATYDTNSADPQLTALEVKNVNPAEMQFSADKDADGTTAANIATNVVNNSGAELPTTGGIGTTIFYIVGAILVVGGGILLVSRRRMSSN